MAGKNQHFLPQFLMRRFATKAGEGKNATFKTIVHHRARGISQPTNVSTLGAQKHFYSKPGPGTLDDDIDRMENIYAPLLERIVGAGAISPEDVPLVCSLVAHLIVRSKRLRRFAEELQQGAAEYTRRVATSPLLFQAVYDRIDDKMLGESLLAEMKTKGIRLGPLEFCRAMVVARGLAAQQRHDDQARLSSGAMIMAAADELARAAKEQAETLHKKVLKKAIDPAPRRTALAKLTWTIVPVEGQALVLADAPVMAFLSSGLPQDALGGEEEPVCVVLPVSPAVALVGRSGASGVPTAEDINLASSLFADEFFIAMHASQETERLMGFLGTGRKPVEPEDWRNAEMELSQPRKEIRD